MVASKALQISVIEEFVPFDAKLKINWLGRRQELAVYGNDGKARIFNEKLKQEASLIVSLQSFRGIKDIDFAGQYLYAISGNQLSKWDLEKLNILEVHDFDYEPKSMHLIYRNGLRYVVIANQANEILLYNSSFDLIKHFKGRNRRVRHLEYLEGRDELVVVDDLSSSPKVISFRSLGGLDTLGISFSSTARRGLSYQPPYLAVKDYGQLLLLNEDSGQEVRVKLEEKPLETMQVAGRYVFATTDEGQGLYFWASDGAYRKLPLSGKVLAVSEENKQIVTGGNGQPLRIYKYTGNFNNPQLIHTIDSHYTLRAKTEMKEHKRRNSVGEFNIIYVIESDSSQMSKDYPIKKIQFLHDQKQILVQYQDKVRFFSSQNFNEIWSISLSGTSSPLIKTDQSNTFLAMEKGSKIELWSLWERKLIAEIELGEIASALSFKGRDALLIGASNGLIYYWDIEKRDVLFSIEYDEQGYIIFDNKSGYYFGNGPYLQENISFKVGGAIYYFEQFDLQYNRPDLILSKLNTASPKLIELYHRAYLKRLKKFGFGEDGLTGNTNLPEIEILTPSIPITTRRQLFPLEIRAKDEQAGLDRINVYINDVPIYGVEGASLRDKNRSSCQERLEIQLSRGKNKVQVSVHNKAGMESLKETFFTTYEEADSGTDLFFIGLGLGQFSDPSMNLDYAVKDVKDLAGVFREASLPFENVVVEEYYNEEVSPSLLQAIRKKLMKTHIDDCVILYVAGHGIVDENLDYYLATYGMDFERPSVEGLPFSSLENIFDGIPARKKLLLLDACHSGEIDKESVRLIKAKRTSEGQVSFRSFETQVVPLQLGLENSFDLMRQLFVDLRRGTGATVIASASGVEFAMEGEEWSNGVFTYCLIRGLRDGKADLDNDGDIRISELQGYLAREVPSLTNGQQRPTFRVENISNDWRIW